MKSSRIALLFCAVFALSSTPLWAQMPMPPPPVSAPPVTPPASLDISPNERNYFELGTVLARGTFAYAPLGSAAGWIERRRIHAKIETLGRLAPEALRERDLAATSFTRAAQIMQDLHAPDPIRAPIDRLAARLSRPLVLTPDARAIESLNKDAALVLSALSESQSLSKVMNDKAMTHWLNVPSERRSGPVWYAEGLTTGVAEIAAAHHLPELLPPVADLATDLRGLRDWLALRVPENPTPDLAALQAGIAAFLQEASHGQGLPHPPHAKPITDAQLSQLGDISRLLQSQILLPSVS